MIEKQGDRIMKVSQGLVLTAFISLTSIASCADTYSPKMFGNDLDTLSPLLTRLNDECINIGNDSCDQHLSLKSVLFQLSLARTSKSEEVYADKYREIILQKTIDDSMAEHIKKVEIAKKNIHLKSIEIYGLCLKAGLIDCEKDLDDRLREVQ